MSKYIYNTKTKTLHIKEMCHYVSAINKDFYNYEVYSTEDAVFQKYGRAVSMCKVCMKNRDKK